MKKTLSVFLSAVLAGVAIALGGTVFLLLESKLAGAVFFTVGLFVVCTRGLHLFTGRLCYVFERDAAYARELPVIWLGNLCGATAVALLERAARIAPALSERAGALCAAKLGDGLVSLFVLGAFCNVLIFLAVDGFRNNPHETGKYLALFFGVTVFILCGFEHCVADMYYFAAGGAWGGGQAGGTLLRLAVITLGNFAGGVAFPLLHRAIARLQNG